MKEKMRISYKKVRNMSKHVLISVPLLSAPQPFVRPCMTLPDPTWSPLGLHGMCGEPLLDIFIYKELYNVISFSEIVSMFVASYMSKEWHCIFFEILRWRIQVYLFKKVEVFSNFSLTKMSLRQACSSKKKVF